MIADRQATRGKDTWGLSWATMPSHLGQNTTYPPPPTPILDLYIARHGLLPSPPLLTCMGQPPGDR